MAKKEENITYDCKTELYNSLLKSYKQLLKVIGEPISDTLDEDKRLKAFEIKGKLKVQAIAAEQDIAKIRKELFENHDEVAAVVKESVDIKRQVRNSLNGDVEKRVMQSEK
jgi:hypothetical protein